MADNVTKLNPTPEIRIVVDDGSVKVPICNKFGDEIGIFYFRPTDLGLIDRYNSMVEDFDKITAPLADMDINPDGTVDNADEAKLAAMRESTLRLYNALDNLLGGNMSEAFFGKAHPFSIVDGNFYCENAINAVGKYISQVFDRETKKVQSRVAKYTHGYTARTGKHKDGKK